MNTIDSTYEGRPAIIDAIGEELMRAAKSYSAASPSWLARLRRRLTLPLVIAVGIPVGAGIAVASGSLSTDGFEIPDPSRVTPVSELNRVGQVSDELLAACSESEPARQGPVDLSRGDTPPPDPTSCALAEAVEQGLVEEGQLLSNEELEQVLQEVGEPRG